MTVSLESTSLKLSDAFGQLQQAGMQELHQPRPFAITSPILSCHQLIHQHQNVSQSQFPGLPHRCRCLGFLRFGRDETVTGFEVVPGSGVSRDVALSV